MSVSLAPSNTLGFRRPLNILVKRPLTITNPNAESAVAWKVKTTAPTLYCVRPNSGRLNPRQSVDVSVMLQPLSAEPPLNAKCKDKFLVQSTLITPGMEAMSLQDIWTSSADASDDSEGRIHQQKLRVVYLPAEGQTLVEEEEEEEEGQNNARAMSTGVSRYATVRLPLPNGVTESESASGASTPPGDASVALEEPQAKYTSFDAPGIILAPSEASVSASEPVPAAAPLPATIPVSTLVPTVALTSTMPTPVILPSPLPPKTYAAKYAEAQAEIERLRAMLATSQPNTELQRRTRKLSDERTTVDVAVEGTPIQEGVPPQVVVIIALGVFITTYLFF